MIDIGPNHQQRAGLPHVARTYVPSFNRDPRPAAFDLLSTSELVLMLERWPDFELPRGTVDRRARMDAARRERGGGR